MIAWERPVHHAISCSSGRSRAGGTVLIPTVVMAACVAVLGGLAMRGTGVLTKPVSAAAEFVVLPLIASFAFNVLASLSGGAT
jgi:hypothetical protein